VKLFCRKTQCTALRIEKLVKPFPYLLEKYLCQEIYDFSSENRTRTEHYRKYYQFYYVVHDKKTPSPVRRGRGDAAHATIRSSDFLSACNYLLMLVAIFDVSN
jgi:hypothetical protein